MERAIFAAGCFWGVQFYFDQIPGVTASRVGYSGGHTASPTYEEVCTHTTGHAEAVELHFDPDKVSYDVLCRHFFRLHNPTQLNRQGPDIGDNYRSAIFYVGDKQMATARTAHDAAQADWNEPIVTTIEPAGPYYVAEDYHQKYTTRTGRGMCHVAYEPLDK